MKKYQIYFRLYHLLLVGIFMIAVFSFSVHATADEFSYFNDEEGIFSESLKKDYDETFRNHLKKYGCFLLVTVGDQEAEDSDKLAEEYLDTNGITEKHSILLLYFNLYNHSVGLAARGEAREIFLPEYNKIFFEHTSELLSKESFDYEELLKMYEGYSVSVLESVHMEKMEVSEIKNFVDDTQGYFSEEALAKINERLTKADSIFDMDIRITTQKDFRQKEIDRAAIKYIEEHELGEKRENSAFLLYISKKPRKFSLMARDRAQDIFSERKREDIFDAMLPFMKENRYDEALEVFTEMTLKDLTELSIRKALSIPEREKGLYFYERVKEPLSDDLHKEINEKLKDISDSTDTDVVVYVEDNSNEGNLYEQVREFAIKHRLGENRANDAVIFYIDIKRELCLITGRGKGLRLILGASADFMNKTLRNYFDVTKYEESIYEFIEKIDDQITEVLKKEAEKEKGLNPLEAARSGLGLGIPVGIIGFLLIFIRTLKRAKADLIFDYKSTMKYVGGVVFHVKNDRLIRTTSRRVYDKDDRDSGSSSGSASSSSSYSSGGSSYGGTSGDY